MRFSLNRISLLWRILLSTSIPITAVLVLTGWLIQVYVARANEQTMDAEVRTSLEAYKALWNSRIQTLAAISRIISSMSDVRAAFMTHDQATIRDSAQELWSRVSQQDAIFLVLAPNGELIASLSGRVPSPAISWPSIKDAANRFPEQASGFLATEDGLLYVVLTPVYVQSAHDQALLNILLAGFEVDRTLTESLKQSTQGSDFAFISNGRSFASTLPAKEATLLTARYNPRSGVQRLDLRTAKYLAFSTPLNDIEGRNIGHLLILHSSALTGQILASLQKNVAAIWLLAILISSSITYLLARRIVKPIERLDIAASEIAHHNYDYRVSVESEDELGRLAGTFNQMCDSIRDARQELIRQERISTIGRLSTSIVHDLRNPLASIYACAEMFVDGDLPPNSAKRLATNIYAASRRIQELLQDLTNINGGKDAEIEECRLVDVVDAAVEMIAPLAAKQNVRIVVDVRNSLEAPIQRARMERVFLNLMNNSIDAMPEGGELHVTATNTQSAVLVQFDDTGTGISEQVRAQLFQPFIGIGKPNGLGIGLALARQTALDHGGDLWLGEKKTRGARFCLQLPVFRR